MTAERVCKDCPHRSICVVHKAVAKFITETFERANAPFTPDDLGRICRYGIGVLQLNSIVEEMTEEGEEGQ